MKKNKKVDLLQYLIISIPTIIAIFFISNPKDGAYSDQEKLAFIYSNSLYLIVPLLSLYLCKIIVHKITDLVLFIFLLLPIIVSFVSIFSLSVFGSYCSFPCGGDSIHLYFVFLGVVYCVINFFTLIIFSKKYIFS